MDEETATDNSFIVRVDLEVIVTDPDALKQSALRIIDGSAADPSYREEGRELVHEGTRSAVVVAVDGTHLDHLDGIEEVALEVSTIANEPRTHHEAPPTPAEAPTENDPEEARRQQIDKLLKDGELASGLDLELLGFDEELQGRDREKSLRQAKLLAGCLWASSTVVIDELFMDITSLSELEVITAEGISQTFVLSNLPQRFAHRYSSLFAQKLMTVIIDLTSKFTRGWSAPSCVAQELGLKLLLDGVEVTADLWDVDLAPHWRGRLEDMLFQDLDHELLYARSMDGFEDDPDPELGMAPMKFEDWFTPFNGHNLPPYVLG